MSEELKSAFEIEGFLEGECEIQGFDDSGFLETYRFELNEIQAKSSGWKKSVAPKLRFKEKRFMKAVPKMYRYDFEIVNSQLSTPDYTVYNHHHVVTNYDWNKFRHIYGFKGAKLIETKEIEE